ncbi:Hypothetical Protein FCC1311_058072 [Hondaea fermentalgiana]|uniref:Uncharacterized protein n=1 Tax=Hondaea fermentalgiana TaxID=2315210 RepID=A0A2R5GF71_9STRA|nr:Hypothetical Protein FCC1311_058072 [Hondaea fermentalgiana]|eukprot:GBG29586.1 Hypothetical Protein FCC1311_058072 [Hondaea fermentalgiana]
MRELLMFAMASHLLFYGGAQLAGDELEWQRDWKGPLLDDTVVWAGRLLVDAALMAEGVRARSRVERRGALSAVREALLRYFSAAVALLLVSLAADGRFRREVFGARCAAHWLLLQARDQLGSARCASFAIPHLWYASVTTRALVFAAALPRAARPALLVGSGLAALALAGADQVRREPSYFPCMLEGRGCAGPPESDIRDATSLHAWFFLGFLAPPVAPPPVAPFLAAALAAPGALPFGLACVVRAVGSLVLRSCIVEVELAQLADLIRCDEV